MYRNADTGEHFTLNANRTFTAYADFGGGFTSISGIWGISRFDEEEEDGYDREFLVGLTESGLENVYLSEELEMMVGLYGWFEFWPGNMDECYVADGSFGMSPVESVFRFLLPADGGASPGQTSPGTTSPAAPGTSPEGFRGEAISAGIMLRWGPAQGGVGFRIYRTDDSSAESELITVPYITDIEFIDVNVRPNTTYHYSLYQVISGGARSEDGPALGSISIRAPETILGGSLAPPVQGAKKNFILMKLDSPMMSVNGVSFEIDPGRGTAPLTLSGRTMVQIRAIVEGMGGNVGWNDTIKEISLEYGEYKVRMWLDSNSINANGAARVIDVAPTELNGRTMVPVRFAAENLGAEVDWLNSTRQVVIVYY